MESEARISIRLPAALHQRIRELARRDRRSLNSEFIVLLERAAVRAEQQEHEPAEQ